MSARIRKSRQLEFPFSDEMISERRDVISSVMGGLTPEQIAGVRGLRQDLARSFIHLEACDAAQDRILEPLHGLMGIEPRLSDSSSMLFERISNLDDLLMAFNVNKSLLTVDGVVYGGGLFLISAGPSASGKDDVMGKPKYTPEGDLTFDAGTALDRVVNLRVNRKSLIQPSEIGRPVKVTNRSRRPRYLKDAEGRGVEVPILVDGKLELRSFEVLGAEVTGSVEDSTDVILKAMLRVVDSQEYTNARTYLRSFTERAERGEVSHDERSRILELSNRRNIAEASEELIDMDVKLSEMVSSPEHIARTSALIQNQVQKGSGEINGVDYWFFRRTRDRDDFRTLEEEAVFDVAYTYSKARYGFAQEDKAGLYATYQMTYTTLPDAIAHVGESMRRDPVLAEVISRYGSNKATAIMQFILGGTEIPPLRKENPRAADGTVTIRGLKELVEDGRYKLIILGSGTAPEVEVMLRRYPESELSYMLQGAKDRPILRILEDMRRFQEARETEDPERQEDRRIECGPHILRALNLEGDANINPNGRRIHILENTFDDTEDKRVLQKTQRLTAIMLAAKIAGYDQQALREIVNQLLPGVTPITEADVRRIGVPLQ